MIVNSLALILFLALASSTQAWPWDRSKNCPPPGFDSKKDFDLRAYVEEGRWYIQQQQVVQYLPPENFFCVVAQYKFLNERTVEVNNFANKGSVNGPLQGGGGLRAVIPNPSNPSKLRVGPAFLQWISWLAYGDYWVLEAGKYPESFKGKGDQTQSSNRVYDWAIVSGGAPKFDSNGKCRTGTGTNGSGLWIFTRDPIVSPEVVDYIRGIIEQKGFDLSVLKPVTQAGCKYEGFGQ